MSAPTRRCPSLAPTSAEYAALLAARDARRGYSRPAPVTRQTFAAKAADRKARKKEYHKRSCERMASRARIAVVCAGCGNPFRALKVAGRLPARCELCRVARNRELKRDWNKRARGALSRTAA